MTTARERGLPVAAHCGSAAGRGVRSPGWSQRRARVCARRGGRQADGRGRVLSRADDRRHPRHGVDRGRRLAQPPQLHAEATAPGHAEAVRAAVDAGVPIACGADLNPIGPRLHAELRLLESIGLDRRFVLHAATAGKRAARLRRRRCTESGGGGRSDRGRRRPDGRPGNVAEALDGDRVRPARRRLIRSRRRRRDGGCTPPAAGRRHRGPVALLDDAPVEEHNDAVGHMSTTARSCEMNR